MIYECTDCANCANFADGFRVICLHDELESNSVCEYQPVGDKDAFDCPFFDDWYEAKYFTWEEFGEAEEYSMEHHNGIITYQGIKEWCLKQND